MKIGTILLFVSTLLITTSCQRELTEELALKLLGSQSEFTQPFYAPFHIGEEILNGENHKNPDKYFKEHLGALLTEGLVEAQIAESNSWRSVVNIQLTKAGEAFADLSRKTPKNIYVKSCNTVPVRILNMSVIEPEKLIKVKFEFETRDVTLFGEHLGFENGKEYSDTRTFIRKTGGWKIQ